MLIPTATGTTTGSCLRNSFHPLLLVTVPLLAEPLLITDLPSSIIIGLGGLLWSLIWELVAWVIVKVVKAGFE
jgi:hypothetical protein